MEATSRSAQSAEPERNSVGNGIDEARLNPSSYPSLFDFLSNVLIALIVAMIAFIVYRRAYNQIV